MSDLMLLGALRMPIQDDPDPMTLNQFVSRARQSADRIESHVAKLEELSAEIERLRAQQAEPVAWAASVDGVIIQTCIKAQQAWVDQGWTVFPLYAAPPRREWVPLTDEEIKAIWNPVAIDGGAQAFARAIEQALRSRNEQA